MRKHLSILLFLTVSLTFQSCEKVIEIDLANSNSVVVIEAMLNNGKAPFTVLISKTFPYFGESTAEQISGAKVSMRVENGKPKYLKEISPGVYQLEKVTAFPENWYIVDVEYEGITYSARSYLHSIVPIIDIGLTHFDGFGFFDSGYKISCFIRDPGSVTNFYRMKLYVNDKVVNNEGEIDIYNDKLFNGKVIGLVQNSSVVFDENDTVIVELQAIDKAAYDYFSTLENISGIEILQSASPTNPISNFNNGALGYFSAYSYDQRKVIIKDLLKN